MADEYVAILSTPSPTGTQSYVLCRGSKERCEKAKSKRLELANYPIPHNIGRIDIVAAEFWGNREK